MASVATIEGEQSSIINKIKLLFMHISFSLFFSFFDQTLFQHKQDKNMVVSCLQMADSPFRILPSDRVRVGCPLT